MSTNLIPTSVRNLRWINAEKTAFNAFITLENGDNFEATVDRLDKLDHIQHVWQEALKGTYGNIKAYVVPPTKPIEQIREEMQPLSRRQLRLGLLKNGITSDIVYGVIADMPDGIEKETYKIEWEESNTFYRTNPTLNAIAGKLSIPQATVDDMWRESLEL